MNEGNKYENINAWNYITDVFDFLPLGAIVEDKIFCVHSGLTFHTEVIDDIQLVDRFCDIKEDGIPKDFLWNEPIERLGWNMSLHSNYCTFGADISESFNTTNNFITIIRSHNLVKNGYEWKHNRNILSIFSASNYGGRGGNLGAISEIDEHINFNLIDFLPPEVFKASIEE